MSIYTTSTISRVFVYVNNTRMILLLYVVYLLSMQMFTKIKGPYFYEYMDFCVLWQD